jgi:hypothetical protein
VVNLSKLTKKRLGELLIDEGLVSEDQVNEALRLQRETGELLGEVLVDMGAVSERDIARAMATQFGLPYMDATRYVIPTEVMNVVPAEQMLRDQYVILDLIGNSLVIAVSGMLIEPIFTELEEQTGCELFFYVSTVTQVRDAIRKYYNVSASE